MTDPRRIARRERAAARQIEWDALSDAQKLDRLEARGQGHSAEAEKYREGA